MSANIRNALSCHHVYLPTFTSLEHEDVHIFAGLLQITHFGYLLIPMLIDFVKYGFFTNIYEILKVRS